MWDWNNSNNTMFEVFCNSPLWSNESIWESFNPEITECFQKTILIWIPAVTFCILSLLDIYFSSKSKMDSIPWSYLNISKMFILLLLIIVNLVELGLLLFNTTSHYALSDVCALLLRSTVYIFVIFLVYYHKVKGICSSGFLFIFWLITIICGSVQLRSEFHEIMGSNSDRTALSISYVIQYSFVIILFVSSFWADYEPSYFQDRKSKNQSPELVSSFISKILYICYDSFIWKGFKKPIQTADLWSLPSEFSTHFISKMFNFYWFKACHKTSNSSKKKRTSVLSVVIKMTSAHFLFGSFLKLIHTLLGFVTPLLLGYIIEFIENARHEPPWKGYFYAVLMFSVSWVQSLIICYYSLIRDIDGMRIQTALMSAVYSKSLRISKTARKVSTIGEIVNLMAVDAQKFQNITDLDLFWSTPLQILVSTYILWNILGVSIFIGLSIMLIMIPINFWATNKFEILQSQQMKQKDKRIKIMFELLNCIKILKLYAWELCFEQKVLSIRQKELNTLKKMWYLNSLISLFWCCTPLVLSLATLTSFVLIDENNILDYQKAYVTLTLFDNLRKPLIRLPMLIAEVVQMSISLKRITAFMNSDELNSEDVIRKEIKNSDTSFSLTMKNATFSWGNETILKIMNLNIKKGSLNAVVGNVGAGKSSLLSASLGEMVKISGTVSVCGTTSYVSQEAWVQNATLRDNILFGKPFIQSFYDEVIEACALKSDIELFPGGDLVEIGANAVNLSGGQKQRVNLARAVYNYSDIYLMDDPLSAVDINVGKHIFQKVIGPNGILKNKTRVLVTHNIDCLPFTDNIIILNNGSITHEGIYSDLMSEADSFSQFLTEHLAHQNSENSLFKEDTNLQLEMPTPERVPQIKNNRTEDGEKLSKESSIVKGKLIETEKSEIGAVKWQVYLYYLRSIGWYLIIAEIFINIIYQGFRVANYFWLSVWAGDEDRSDHELFVNIGTYSLFGLGQALSSIFLDLIPLLGCWYATRTIHINMLRSVLRAPLTYFISLPTGRIISRFSKDIDILDTRLPYWFGDCVYGSVMIGITFAVMCYSVPYLSISILPLTICCYYLREFFIRVSRQLKRLESVSRSPIYSHFSETITGVAVIRAFEEQKRFINNIELLIDKNNSCYYPLIIVKRWLNIRLDLICNLLIVCTVMFFVSNPDIVEPGLVGFCLSFSLSLTTSINWFFENSAQLETNIVSVERVKEFCETESEAVWDKPDIQTPIPWPNKGEIEFKNYSIRYRPDLNPVLKNINIMIKGGEKVGIVGRTGAGKSTIALALFRILEAAEGSIIIDEIDISTLGLHNLRAHLTIIPQDPVLFSGTIRFNLDPFDKYSDFEIWNALELVHLKHFVESLTGTLNHEVLESGENFSVGQKQLICLARAVLRKTKILILDEATAAVDLETDHLIQMTIKKAFVNCTVLTIAHRLNTIMYSDRLLVIDQGLLMENDNPKNLLSNDKSIFYQMAKEFNLL